MKHSRTFVIRIASPIMKSNKRANILLSSNHQDYRHMPWPQFLMIIAPSSDPVSHLHHQPDHAYGWRISNRKYLNSKSRELRRRRSPGFSHLPRRLIHMDSLIHHQWLTLSYKGYLMNKHLTYAMPLYTIKLFINKFSI